METPPMNECSSPFRDTFGFSESKIFSGYVQTARNRKNTFSPSINFEKELIENKKKKEYDEELNY